MGKTAYAYLTALALLYYYVRDQSLERRAEGGDSFGHHQLFRVTQRRRAPDFRNCHAPYILSINHCKDRG